MTKQQYNFKLENSGFFLSVQQHQLAASPDRMIRYECCGNGCLEIKYPYSVRDKNNINVPWLVMSYETILLSKSHCYYYHVQLQMFVCSQDHRDFVVWWPNDQHVERIVKNDIIF